MQTITFRMELKMKRSCWIARGASLVAQTVKESAGNAGDPSAIPGS